MKNKLYTVDEVKRFVKEGRIMVLAGDEALFKELPQGNWIAGTIPYFMDSEGGCINKDKIFVTDFTDFIQDFSIKLYDVDGIDKITDDSFENGFSFVLIPAFSNILAEFALHPVKNFTNPLVGWVAGIDFSDLGKVKPKVIAGKPKLISDSVAIVLHAKLPADKIALVEIYNNHEIGDGDIVQFTESGFTCETSLINGEEHSLAEYIKSNPKLNGLPLMADYAGAKINVGVLEVSADHKEVTFAAPVYPDTEYRFAKPIENKEDYYKRFPEIDDEIISSYNCVSNFLNFDLTGKSTGNITGPFTFGEIAYILLNETMVYLKIENTD